MTVTTRQAGRPMRKQTVALCIAMTLMAVGCVSRGRPFVRPEPETLVLGKTTYEDVIRQVGEPASVGTLFKNDCALKVITYSYIRPLNWPAEWGVIPLTALSFFFLDDVLVGHHYTSAHPEDKTDFHDTKAYQLKKGQTTRAQVIELLGRPSGLYIYPMIGSKTDTALVYFYHRIKLETRFLKGLRPMITQKMLIVSFDTQDLVSAADFGPSAEK